MSKKAKVITGEYEVFYFVKIEARIPQTILKKLNKVKVQAHKKIPGLIIWDREKKCKILVRLYGSKIERTINGLGSFQVVELALEHFLTCRKGKYDEAFPARDSRPGNRRQRPLSWSRTLGSESSSRRFFMRGASLVGSPWAGMGSPFSYKP